MQGMELVGEQKKPDMKTTTESWSCEEARFVGRKRRPYGNVCASRRRSTRTRITIDQALKKCGYVFGSVGIVNSGSVFVYH